MMKNEVDIAEYVVRHLVEELVDGILIADNLSEDNTRARLEAMRSRFEGQCPIVIALDDEVGYYQSRKMTALAQRAHEEFGADWIIPFDADEIWYAHGDAIGPYLRAMPDHITALAAPLFNHFPSSIDRKSDVPFEAIEWRQPKAGPLPKVAFRWRDGAVIQQGNHAVAGAGLAHTFATGLELRHFPYRSFEQFVRKARVGAAAYAATDLHETEGAHWRSYGRILEERGEEGLREVYERYFCFMSPVDEGMVFDPAPYRRWHRG